MPLIDKSIFLYCGSDGVGPLRVLRARTWSTRYSPLSLVHYVHADFWVGALGIGPRTSFLSGTRSTTEPCAQKSEQ